jgi:hypothetical protein
MPGIEPPQYMRLGEYNSKEHVDKIAMVHRWMNNTGVRSIEFIDGDLRLNYIVGATDIIEKTEFDGVSK